MENQKQDFMAWLPLELIEHILFYLDPAFVIDTCVLVSKTWQMSIQSCEHYWKKTIMTSDLPPDIVKQSLPKFKSHFSLAKRFIKRELSMKKQFLSGDNFLTMIREQDDIVWPDPLSNGYYLRCRHSTPLFLMKIDEDMDDVYCQIDNASRKVHISKILWCTSTDEKILFLANSGIWGEFKLDPSECLSPVFTEWMDELHTRFDSRDKFSICKSCNLILTAKYNWNRELQCTFIELKKSPVKTVRYTRIEKEMSEEISDLLLNVGHIQLCCHRHNEEGTCVQHTVFILGIRVLLRYSVVTHIDSGETQLEAEQVKDITHLGLVQSIAVSEDQKLLRMVGGLRKIFLYTWDIETGSDRETVEMTLNPVDISGHVDFLAVGTIYSVIVQLFYNNTKHLQVVYTRTGRLLLSLQLPASVHFSCNVDWMSSLFSDKLVLYKIHIEDKLSDPFETSFLEYAHPK